MKKKIIFYGVLGILDIIFIIMLAIFSYQVLDTFVHIESMPANIDIKTRIAFLAVSMIGSIVLIVVQFVHCFKNVYKAFKKTE